MKAIAGVTESPIQVVLLGFLMLKGVLVFPWNKEVSSTCIEDELGRRLCLPSIPMVSIAFSLASILKAMYEMNLGLSERIVLILLNGIKGNHYPLA